MKKLIALLMALCLLLSAGAALADVTYPIKTDKPVKLKVWMEMNAGASQVFTNYMENPVYQRFSEVTGIELEMMHPTYGAAGEGFGMMLAGSELPDIIVDLEKFYNGGAVAAYDDELIYDLTPYLEENAMIVEEILRQRLVGIKNESGVYVTPAFPKLVYVLDENNNLTGGRFDYLTKLAAKCSAKRMYPDYISAKKMRENYEGNVFSPMGCRSFLAPWKDENGNYKFEGRFNQGVVSINLPQIGLEVRGDIDKFWPEFDRRLDVCYEALMCRHNALKGVKSDVSPIHWQYGALARLKKDEPIDKLLYGGYSTLSLGYIGLYELTYLMTGKSHTTEEGQAFALEVMNHLNETVLRWRAETNIGFALYGTPAESLCYSFAEIDRERYGTVENVTDKGYYTNSYHVDVREDIDAFSKFQFESQFQSISKGGCISYVEVPNMSNNLTALEDVIHFIYDNIQYAEFNTKSDYCQVCGYEGEIRINDNLEWECPVCGNRDQRKMNVVRRTCGYLGENYWNVGKTKEIRSRVMHL